MIKKVIIKKEKSIRIIYDVRNIGATYECNGLGEMKHWFILNKDCMLISESIHRELKHKIEKEEHTVVVDLDG